MDKKYIDTIINTIKLNNLKYVYRECILNDIIYDKLNGPCKGCRLYLTHTRDSCCVIDRNLRVK